MNKELNNLKILIIGMKEIPQSEQVFAGANLIISDNQNRIKHEQDVLVLTDNPKELSWFVFKLKEIFSNDIDYMNKYSFYPDIGNLLNLAISKEIQLKDQLIYVLNNIGEFKK
ncbi:MAG: hypothetical protein P8O87_09295 [Crocinitomicaceae bacterium]|nr:hypothetical protein [Crocinitomicaceae bacterium]